MTVHLSNNNDSRTNCLLLSAVFQECLYKIYGFLFFVHRELDKEGAPDSLSYALNSKIGGSKEAKL